MAEPRDRDVRRCAGAGGLAAAASRIVDRCVAQAGQEGRGHAIGELRRGRRAGAHVGLDRRAETRARRRLVAAEAHAAHQEEHLVEDQLRQGGGADRRRQDGAERPRRGRARQDRRTLGASVRLAAHVGDAGGSGACAAPANWRAAAFFETIDAANRYAILWRVQTAKKAETRARRIEASVAMLARKETLHPLRKKKAK